MSNDEDLAADLAEGRISLAPAATGPRVSEWSPIRAALAEISDRLSMLTIAVLAAGGAKVLPKFTPAPRPVTSMTHAAAAARKTAEARQFDEIVALFSAEPEPD